MQSFRQEITSQILPLNRLIGQAGLAGWLLLLSDIVGTISVRQRDFSEYTAVDGSAVFQMAYVGLCLFYASAHLICCPRKGANYLLVSTPALLLLVYTGLCMLSSLWSPRAFYTLYRSIECLSYLLIIAIACDNLNTNCSGQDFVEWLVLWSFWFLFWDTVRYARIIGISDILSIQAFRRGSFALGILFFITLFISKRSLFTAINLAYNFLSMANTTYFGIAFGLIPGLFVGNRRFHTILFFIAVIVALSYFLIGSSMIQHTLFYGKEGIGLEYTTGRDWLWARSIEYGMKHLFYGYGFAAGESEVLHGDLRALISAHNVLSSAFLSIGIAGPILFFLFFAWLAIQSLRADLPENWKSAFLATTIMIFIMSFASPGLGARVYGAWVPAVLTSLGMCTLARSELLIQLDAIDLLCVEEDIADEGSLYT